METVKLTIFLIYYRIFLCSEDMFQIYTRFSAKLYPISSFHSILFSCKMRLKHFYLNLDIRFDLVSHVFSKTILLNLCFGRPSHVSFSGLPDLNSIIHIDILLISESVLFKDSLFTLCVFLRSSFFH